MMKSLSRVSTLFHVSVFLHFRLYLMECRVGFFLAERLEICLKNLKHLCRVDDQMGNETFLKISLDLKDFQLLREYRLLILHQF